jgi:hypothetical protein
MTMKHCLRLFYLFSFIFILFVLYGCLQKEEIESDNNQSLLLNTEIIDNYTEQELEDIKSKLFDPSTSDRAQIWYPTAEKVISLTNSVRTSIDSCFAVCDKTNLEKNKFALLEMANKYKESILNINTDPDFSQKYKNEFTKLIDSTYFKNFTTLALNKTFQNKMRNSISIMANRIVSRCKERVSPGCILHYEKFSALTGLNAKHFKPGDRMEIMAGVGSFSTASKPDIIIDNEKVSINDLGYAEFKKVVSGKYGKHTIPITIRYHSPEGLLKTTKQEIEYFIDK